MYDVPHEKNQQRIQTLVPELPIIIFLSLRTKQMTDIVLRLYVNSGRYADKFR